MSVSFNVATVDHSVPNPYPNPTESFFQWNIREEALLIQLYDMNGILLKEWANVQSGEQLHIDGITSGSYLLKAETELRRITKKIIIK